MIRIRLIGRCLGIASIAVLISAFVGVSRAYPEAYIGGQFGSTLSSLGSGLSSGEFTDFSPPGTISDRDLKSSFVIGLKAGYYFPKARWFGLETEIFHTTPHIKQQQTSITLQPGTTINGVVIPGSGTATGTLSGDHFRVITWAPVNLMFRYHKTRLQPYVGVGPGVFFGRITSTVQGFEGSQSSTKLGLNAKVGLDYLVTRHLSLFAEGKYNRVKFDFKPSDTQLGYATTYDMYMVLVGVSYHF